MGKYTFSVDLAAVEHLGLNLYSNTAAALTELIANAWDADATEVRITINDDQTQIIITDNGHGMSVDDLNNKFLKVAYKRRIDQAKSPSGRPVMGRKGIGKLALFSIAQHVVITSKQKDQDSHALSINVNKLKDCIASGTPYHPAEESADGIDGLEHGTTFVLTEILSSRVNQSISAMKKRIARRFSVIGEQDAFDVYVNDEKISQLDRDDYRNLQFVWQLPNSKQHEFPEDTKKFNFTSNQYTHKDATYSFSGWIGTAYKPKDLDSSDMGNINGISILSRGRIFQENILDKISENRLIKNYITGVIQADFLDDDDVDDLATSDRQRVREDDPRYIALIEFIKSLINQMFSKWSTERRKYDVEESIKSYPLLNNWLQDLPRNHRKHAEKLLSTVSHLSINSDKEDDRKELFRSTVLAFERLKLEGSAHEFNDAISSSPAELIKIFSSYDSYEVSLYHDIVKSRLHTIDLIQGKIKENDYENSIRDFIYEHLWLIDPTWERVSTTAYKETSVHKMFLEHPDIKDLLSEDERRGRLDLAYRTLGGEHIIIELKRPKLSYKLDDLKLFEQGRKYRDTLFKCLSQTNPTFTDKDRISVIFLIGHRFDRDQKEIENIFNAINGRVSTYDEMLIKAKAAYGDFLESTKELDKIKKLVDSLS
ncbi:ATP-binding protein [Moraxella sp. FZFQ2102]|uniref:BbrUII/HgiDII family restriction enzyme n=1 Tax=Moraxella sp. FZFQ2102 TaxID=2953752 RepID=UPI00209C4B81|nr:ATP-binding protein [Moraxella sp. FZFQ2102]USZ14661.1 ATP-binding protein [Moraxella sp. FZFQ2102]